MFVSRSPMRLETTVPQRNRNKRGTSKRKQRLLELLDALNELTNDEEAFPEESNLRPNLQDRDVPTIDEHHQPTGADSFAKFERNMINFDRQPLPPKLRNFSNAAGQLDSSVGVLPSAYRLRERIAKVLHLFSENAACLFPIKAQHQDSYILPLSARRNRHKPPMTPTSSVATADVNPEDLPEQISLFAEDITAFLEYLNEFPEFTDEILKGFILDFQGDLRYWASCLHQYTGQFKSPPVQQYLHDLSSDLGEHIENITSALSQFIEVGVPAIVAQKHGNLVNLSTIATFFSSVTVTSLQFSFDNTGSTAANAVNSFWFTSLVLSIAVVVNNLLGLTWKQYKHRFSPQLTPWWVGVWIERLPIIFLISSIACFLAGLVTFAYSSHQHVVTSTITTVFFAFSSFGLVTVSTWFASEYIAMNRYKWRDRLAGILRGISGKIEKVPGHKLAKAALRKLKATLVRSTRVVRRALVPRRLTGARFERSYSNPIISLTTDITAQRPNFVTPTVLVDHLQIGQGERHFGDADGYTSNPSLVTSPTIPPTSEPGTEASPALARFRHLARNAAMVHRLMGLGDEAMAKVLRTDQEPEEILTRPGGFQVAKLVPKLQSMAPTQDIAAHAALVRHMQFSPDGNFLATASWDRTAIIFHIGEQATSHRILLHLTGVVSQVTWSPSGNLIITRLPRAIKIWTPDGVCRKTIERGCSVESITWLPHGEAFLSVEESSIVRVDINGTVLNTYEFEHVSLHDAAVTPDSQRIFAVGTLVRSVDGLRPSRSRNEKQIITFNLDREEIENRVPTLHEVRGIEVSQNSQFVLVSYEDKAPPQLWKVEIEPTRRQKRSPSETSARLRLRHTYMPKVTVDYAGPSHFGGRNDELIISAGKAGDIHIWDRESAGLLHHVRAQMAGGDLTCLAWSPAAGPFMFATGGQDGAVRIWTAVDLSPQASPYTYPESEEGGGTPRTRRQSLHRLGDSDRLGSASTEGGLKADELRTSLGELGTRFEAGGQP